MRMRKNTAIFIILIIFTILGYFYYYTPIKSTLLDNMGMAENSLYGEITKINSDRVDILSGDIVYIFEIDNNILEEYYIGEFVSISGNDSNAKIAHAKYPVEDFDSMGNKIEELRGSVVSIKNENSFVINSNGKEYEFKSYDENNLNKGDNITVRYIVINGENSAIKVLNEDKAEDIIVEGLERTKEGFLVIIGNNGDGIKKKYTLNESSDIMLNISKLKTGSKIKIYTETTEGDINVALIKNS